MPAFADTYNAVAGAVLYGGQAVPAAPLPAWLASETTLLKVIEIPGSSGAGGAAVIPWGGYAADLDGNRLFLACSGGHGDSSDNRVVMLDLNADTTAWELLKASTPVEQRSIDVFHYADGQPASRHIYDYCHWVPQIGRILLVGARGLYGNAWDGSYVDAFDPISKTWDNKDTYIRTTGHGSGGAVDHINGRIFMSAFKIFTPGTNTVTNAGTSIGIQMRYPVAYSTARNHFFGLHWGGGESESNTTTLSASTYPSGGGSQVAITFNSSAAYTQFLADRLYTAGGNNVGYSGMTYDSANDCFYWYSGYDVRANRIYKIVPNNTTVWDMELLVLASGSLTLPAPPGAGVNGRIKYFPKLKGFIINPTGSGSVYFVKTSL